MADTAAGCWSRAWERVRRDLDQAPDMTFDISSLKAWPTSSQIEAFARSPLSLFGKDRNQKRGVREKLDSLVKSLHRLAPAFDAFFQQQPFVATVVWGTCRFFLQAAFISSELSEKIRGALTSILPCLFHLERETNLFPDQPAVLDATTEYFVEIIYLLVKARKHFERSKVWRWLKAPFSNEWNEAVESLERLAEKVAKELRFIALKAQVDETAKQQRYRGENSTEVGRIKEVTTDNLEISKSISVEVKAMKVLIDPSTHRSSVHSNICTLQDWLISGVVHNEAIPDPDPNTCENLSCQPTWEKWENLSHPGLLLVYGVTGIGKSVHAQAITKRARDSHHKIVISYFFSASSSKLAAQPRTFAISALSQLLQNPVIKKRKGFSSTIANFAPFLTTCTHASSCRLEGLLQLLRAFLDFVEDYLLVVDGLDECTADEPSLNSLTRFLLDTGDRPGAQLIIFARDEFVFGNHARTISKIRLDRELAGPDVVRFVQQKVGRTRHFDDRRTEIVKAVLAHSHCNFLLANLHIKDIESARTVKQQRLRMSRFADNVPAEYRRFLDESNANLEADFQELRDNIFRTLIAARTPLKVDFISEVLAFDEKAKRMDKESLLFEPAKDIITFCRPFVEISDNNAVAFIHMTVREFLLKNHLTALESDVFLARKCLAALRQSKYRDWHIAAQLLRKHILIGTSYPTINDEVPRGTALYDYATLHFQEHVTELEDPEEDIVQDLAAFLQGVEFVSWSEYLLELTKQTTFGAQIAVYSVLLDWTKKLPESIRQMVPIKDYFEKPHNVLSATFKERSQDKILQYLPLVRNGTYLNSGGQSTGAWQGAYEYKMKVVAGVTDLLGNESPVVLRFKTSLLQEYFWQKRFVEVLPDLLKVARAQRLLGDAAENDLFTTLWLLGLAYHCLTRFDEALAVFIDAANSVADRLGKTDRRYLLIGLYWGHTLEQLLRFDEATVLYNDVRKTLTPIVGSANGFTLMSQTAIGAIQRKTGDYELAKTNLLEGWGGRKKIFSINVNVCLDAALQLALLLRDNQEGKLCLELLEDVSNSKVFEEDFERHCQAEHIRGLVAFDSGDYETPLLSFLRLLHKASGQHRELNNRELMWIRCTSADVMRYLDREGEALMQFSDIVEPLKDEDDSLSDEPESPARLRLAEEAVRLVRQARLADASTLLQSNDLRWVREADFFVLGEGGPVTDTAVIAPIRFSSTKLALSSEIRLTPATSSHSAQY